MSSDISRYLCSFIRMQNEFLQNIRHSEIQDLTDIDLERHVSNDMEDSEDISNSIREILLDTTDDEGLRLFHSIEHTMKSDMIRAHNNTRIHAMKS
jgi:hypothetical protein